MFLKINQKNNFFYSNLKTFRTKNELVFNKYLNFRKNLKKINKKGLLQRNARIELKILNNNYFIRSNEIALKDLNKKQYSILNILPMIFFIKKLYFFNHLNKKNQFFFDLKHLTNCIYKSTLDFWSLNIFFDSNNYNKTIFFKEIKRYNIFNNYLLNTLFNNKTSFMINDIEKKVLINFTKNYNEIHFKNNILQLSNYLTLEKLNVEHKENINFKNNLFFYSYVRFFFNKWKENKNDFILLKNQTNSLNKVFEKSFLSYIKHNYFKSLLNNRNFKNHSNLFFNSFLINNNFFKFNKKNSTIFLKRLIWKKGLYSLKKFELEQKSNKTSSFSTHSLNQRIISKNFIYFLMKLEEKIKNLSLKDNKKTELKKILFLRNLLLLLFEEKLNRIRGKKILLSTFSEIKKLQRFGWRQLFFKGLLSYINIEKNKSKLPENFYEKITNSILKTKRIKLNKVKNKNFSTIDKLRLTWKKRLRMRNTFKEKKVVRKNSYLPLKQTKELLSILTDNNNPKLFFINSLSLTKFGFEKKGKTTANNFLQNIEREMINRYKYVAIYIKDLIQISFISLFLKKPTFLANFVAFQISKLPRNRKETKLIKFIIKTIKIFAAQRKEMIGLRIQFKGRVNRWRRTKVILGHRGIVSFYSYDSRIEYGTSKAVTKKGSLGIRIWFCYKPSFQSELKQVFFDYIDYSKKLRSVLIKRFFYKFN